MNLIARLMGEVDGFSLLLFFVSIVMDGLERGSPPDTATHCAHAHARVVVFGGVRESDEWRGIVCELIEIEAHVED